MAPRAASGVWKYFINIDCKKAKCKSCGAIVPRSGNTQNLWNHLKRHHSHLVQVPVPSNEVSIDEGDPDDPPTPTSAATADPAATTSSAASAASAASGSSFARKRGSTSAPSTSRAQSPKQMTLTRSFESASSFQERGSKDLALREALLYMICRDNLPLQTSDKPGFRNFCKVAVPLWKPPSRGTVTSLMEEKFKKCSALVRDTIAALESYCMSADIWTEPQTVKSYLGVTMHYLDSESNAMASFRLGLRPLSGAHTAAYIGEVIDEVCTEWGIKKERVRLFLTDSAENMKKAVRDTFGYAAWQPCFAHMLNLCADAPFKTIKDKVTGRVTDMVPGLDALVQKAKKIVTFTKHSVKTNDEIRRIQVEEYDRSEGTCLKLQQDVATRWNSTYIMLDRFLEMSDIVSAALLKAKDAPEMLSGGEMYTCRLLLKVFKPFFQITLEISGHKIPTASKVVPLISRAKESLSIIDPGNDPIAKGARDALLRSLHDYFGTIERVRPYVMATLLDPRFKDLHFSMPTVTADAISSVARELKDVMRGEQNRREAAIAAIQQEHEEQRPDPENLWSLHDSRVARQVMHGEDDVNTAIPLQLRDYKRKPVLSREGDPFQQWAVLKSDYPELHTVAMRYLPLISTSVPSESYFSLAGSIATHKRSRLTSEHLAMIAFLGSLDLKVWHAVQ